MPRNAQITQMLPSEKPLSRGSAVSNGRKRAITARMSRTSGPALPRAVGPTKAVTSSHPGTIVTRNRAGALKIRSVHLVTPTHDRFAHWMRGRSLSEKTIKLRAGIMRRATEEIGDLRFVSTGELSAWLGRFSGHTRVTYMSALVAVYDWFLLEDQIDVHPLKDPRQRVMRPPTPEPAPKPFTPDQEAALLASATGDLRAQLLLGLRQGLRCHEIAKFAGEHIIDRRWVEVDGKGGKKARLPVHPDILELADYYPRRGLWFPSSRTSSGHVSPAALSQRFSVFLDLHGLSGSIHRARATYATTLLRNGASIETVRRLGRWSSLKTVMHYVLAAADELEEAINSLGQTPPAA